MLPDLNQKKYHQGQGNPANERFQMLTHLLGHEKSATHTARKVRPFCNSCHRSVAQGVPSCLRTQSSAPAASVYIVRADRGPWGAPARNSPGYPDEEAVSHGAKRSLAFSHVILTSQWAQGLTTLPVLVMREPRHRVTVGRQSVDPGGQDPGPEPFNLPMNDPRWTQSPGSLGNMTQSLSATLQVSQHRRGKLESLLCLGRLP